MNLYDKFKKLINQEIKEENEPKETAVLVRVLCLVDFFFLMLEITILGATCGFVPCVPLYATTLLMMFTFWLSFKIRMSRLIYVYFFSLVINVYACTITFGLSFMFQAQLYIIFMIFFYRAAGKNIERKFAFFGTFVLSIALILYVSKNGHPVEISPYANSYMTFICTFYILCKSMSIAYFFRLKFSASEEKIIRYSKKLEMLATTDPLTKLQNRRGMLNHIEGLVKDFTSGKEGLLTICIGDIDLFKHINDTYGHEAGDYVLETIAKIMNQFMDGKGMVARWGGEEFLFSLEGINGDYAFEEMSKLLHLIEKYEFCYEGTPISVTMTFGIEEYDENLGTDRVISKADEKLYMGKEQGRNRVIY